MRKLFLLTLLLPLPLLSLRAGNNEKERKECMTDSSIVRLSYIEIYPQYHDEYMKMALEVGQTSMLTEPGVLSMYPMGVKKDVNALYILEIYSSPEAYRKHIASAHFQKYKQGTLHMVKHLELIDTNPLNPLMQIKSAINHD